MAITGLIVALGGFVWLVSPSAGPKEPVYEGKSLSQWLRAFDYANRGQPGISARDARRALRAAGTNAIPTLLRMLRATDPPMKLKLVNLLKQQHLVNFRWRMASSLHTEAEVAFVYLGVRADIAVPELEKMYAATPPLASRAVIANMLRNIKQTPYDTYATYLESMLHSPSAEDHVNAFNQIGEQPWAKTAVPTLLEMLKQPGANDYWARFALERIDPDTAGQVLSKTAQNADSAELSNAGSESGNIARLCAVGDWSEPVSDARYRGLRGRLLVYEPPNYTNRAESWGGHAAIEMELQDTDRALEFVPTAVLYSFSDGLECELRDAQKNLVPGVPDVRVSFPTASWITVPFDGAVRFRVDPFSMASPSRPEGLTIQIGRRAWCIPVGDTNDYFLAATFTPPANHINPLDYHVWGGTLRLPPVKISVPKLHPATR